MSTTRPGELARVDCSDVVDIFLGHLLKDHVGNLSNVAVRDAALNKQTEDLVSASRAYLRKLARDCVSEVGVTRLEEGVEAIRRKQEENHYYKTRDETGGLVRYKRTGLNLLDALSQIRSVVLAGSIYEGEISTEEDSFGAIVEPSKSCSVATLNSSEEFTPEELIAYELVLSYMANDLEIEESIHTRHSIVLSPRGVPHVEGVVNPTIKRMRAAGKEFRAFLKYVQENMDHIAPIVIQAIGLHKAADRFHHVWRTGAGDNFPSKRRADLEHISQTGKTHIKETASRLQKQIKALPKRTDMLGDYLTIPQ